MRERDGNLITLARDRHFDVIAQGCNCFCKMSSGIAPQIKAAFPSAWYADEVTDPGDIQKLGTFTYGTITINHSGGIHVLTVINAYTQYKYDASTNPLDYEALTLCMRKINHIYRGSTIGLPLIGCGLAGGDWNRVKAIIEKELNAMDVWIVHYKK
jgi:O-acetyl-ADP-ribose deacetylase (regulator of RNase III)